MAPVWSDGSVKGPYQGPVWGRDYRGLDLERRASAAAAVSPIAKDAEKETRPYLSREVQEATNNLPVDQRKEVTRAILEERLYQGVAEQRAEDAERRAATLEKQATYDEKTGALRHGPFTAYQQRVTEAADRVGGEYGLILIDVDDMKRLNTVHGYAKTDDVLKTIVDKVQEVIAQSVRGYDRVSRFGGDEYVVILPGASLEEAVTVANRINQQVQSMNVPGVNNVSVTMGITHYQGNSADPRSAVEKAQEAFNQANEAVSKQKETGKGKINVFRH